MIQNTELLFFKKNIINNLSSQHSDEQDYIIDYFGIQLYLKSKSSKINNLEVSCALLGGLFQSGDTNKYPLKSILWLEQSNQNKITAIEKTSARLKVIASITNLFNSYLPQNETIKCLTLANDLCEKIPTYLFQNQKELDVKHFIIQENKSIFL